MTAYDVVQRINDEGDQAVFLFPHDEHGRPDYLGCVRVSFNALEHLMDTKWFLGVYGVGTTAADLAHAVHHRKHELGLFGLPGP